MRTNVCKSLFKAFTCINTVFFLWSLNCRANHKDVVLQVKHKRGRDTQTEIKKLEELPEKYTEFKDFDDIFKKQSQKKEAATNKSLKKFSDFQTDHCGEFLIKRIDLWHPKQAAFVQPFYEELLKFNDDQFYIPDCVKIEIHDDSSLSLTKIYDQKPTFNVGKEIFDPTEGKKYQVIIQRSRFEIMATVVHALTIFMRNKIYDEKLSLDNLEAFSKDQKIFNFKFNLPHLSTIKYFDDTKKSQTMQSAINSSTEGEKNYIDQLGELIYSLYTLKTPNQNKNENDWHNEITQMNLEEVVPLAMEHKNIKALLESIFPKNKDNKASLAEVLTNINETIMKFYPKNLALHNILWFQDIFFSKENNSQLSLPPDEFEKIYLETFNKVREETKNNNDPTKLRFFETGLVSVRRRRTAYQEKNNLVELEKFVLGLGNTFFDVEKIRCLLKLPQDIFHLPNSLYLRNRSTRYLYAKYLNNSSEKTRLIYEDFSKEDRIDRFHKDYLVIMGILSRAAKALLEHGIYTRNFGIEHVGYSVSSDGNYYYKYGFPVHTAIATRPSEEEKKDYYNNSSLDNGSENHTTAMTERLAILKTATYPPEVINNKKWTKGLEIEKIKEKFEKVYTFKLGHALRMLKTKKIPFKNEDVDSFEWKQKVYKKGLRPDTLEIDDNEVKTHIDGMLEQDPTERPSIDESIAIIQKLNEKKK